MSEAAQKPSEKRAQQRRQEKQEGRGRRAQLLLEKQVKEQARQDQVEERVSHVETGLAELERRLDAHESRINQLEELSTTPSA